MRIHHCFTHLGVPFLLAAATFVLPACASREAAHRRHADARVLAEQSSAPATAPTTAQPDTAAAPAPTVIEVKPSKPTAVTAGPSNPRSFSPKETTGLALNIPAEKVDLRKLFEDLGEDTTLWYQHVQTLANPFFEGRTPGSRGGQIAAEYIEFYFRLYGLEPAFPSAAPSMGGESSARPWSSYRQSFDFASPNPEIEVLDAQASMNGTSLVQDKDFVVLGISGSGAYAGPVTFVGYGIAQGKDGYTSFEPNTDLTGRIALLLRYEPLNDEGKSQWSMANFSTHSSIANKLKNVAERGAAAVILVNPPGAAAGKTTLEAVKESRRFGTRLDIPAIQISAEAAERLLSQGDSQERDFLTWRKLADSGEIKTEHLNDSLQVSITANLHVNDRMNAENVAGVLRGKGSLADEWIVIGGHYDHVGFGYTGAMPHNVGRLHPGADDNASGTASVLIAARRFAQAYAKARDNAHLRSIVFIGFDAEEAGLHGSKHFVEEPPMSLGAVNLMFNLDMVGRLRNDSLLVQGTGTATGFADMLKPFFESSGMKIAASPTGRGPSDHSNFYGKDVPVLFLFTGTHEDYHQPSDYAYTVNPAGALKIVDLLETLAMHFASHPERLRFAQATATTADRPGRDTGARVSLGTMPDYNAELETGMRVEDVRPGSSAADAGIKAGDVLLTWNGDEIAGPRSIAEFLARHEPGDRVKIVLRRDEREMVVEAALKARQTQ